MAAVLRRGRGAGDRAEHLERVALKRSVVTRPRGSQFFPLDVKAISCDEMEYHAGKKLRIVCVVIRVLSHAGTNFVAARLVGRRFPNFHSAVRRRRRSLDQPLDSLPD